MKLVISDDEVSLVQMALAREHHDRKNSFRTLQDRGHVHVVNSEKPAHITVQIEDEFIDDDRERFPTTVLMARLQLAIAAGRSCRNLRTNDDFYSNDAGISNTINAGKTAHMAQIMKYEQSIGRLLGRRAVGKSQVLAMGYGRDAHIGDFLNEEPTLFPAPLKKRVTAAVKKFAKGLRP